MDFFLYYPFSFIHNFEAVLTLQLLLFMSWSLGAFLLRRRLRFLASFLLCLSLYFILAKFVL
jgi:hypothetical protein